MAFRSNSSARFNKRVVAICTGTGNIVRTRPIIYTKRSQTNSLTHSLTHTLASRHLVDRNGNTTATWQKDEIIRIRIQYKVRMNRIWPNIECMHILRSWQTSFFIADGVVLSDFTWTKRKICNRLTVSWNWTLPKIRIWYEQSVCVSTIHPLSSIKMVDLIWSI